MAGRIRSRGTTSYCETSTTYSTPQRSRSALDHTRVRGMRSRRRSAAWVCLLRRSVRQWMARRRTSARCWAWLFRQGSLACWVRRRIQLSLRAFPGPLLRRRRASERAESHAATLLPTSSAVAPSRVPAMASPPSASSASESDGWNTEPHETSPSEIVLKPRKIPATTSNAARLNRIWRGLIRRP